MGSLQIGSRIAERRKSKGITQEELANYLGVSKPAVSKWESGQSYPDILLLPELAAYFNVSIDELVGYEPQMTHEEIQKLYRRLAEAFTKEPVEKVLGECDTYLKKYYSCWQLQIHMGLLLINHISLLPEQDRVTEVIHKVLEIFQRVEKESGDAHLANQAVKLQAVCYLSLQQPVQAIELLEQQNELSSMHSEVMLVRAYQMKGDLNKAMEYLQGYVYVNLMSILGAAPDFYQMYAGDPAKLDRIYGIYRGLTELFEIEELHPALVMQMELSASMVQAGLGNNTKALDSLERCLQLMVRIGKGKLLLKGNAIFDVLERYFADLDIEAAAPRNSETIWHDLKNLIRNNPSFAGLKEESRYKHILSKLDSI